MSSSFSKWLLIFSCGFVLSGCTLPPEVVRVAPGLAGLFGQSASGSGALAESAVVVGDDESEVVASVEVLYIDLGFEPAELTIAPNTRVVFLNQSANRLWVKSDQPFWSMAEQFDGKTGVKGGEWVSVIFKKPGTWRYLNYMQNKQTGVIVVE